MFSWQDVLDFWFGTLDEQGLPDSFHRNRWFRGSRTFDHEILRRYLSLLVVASEDGLRDWRSEPGGRLAELLLLDQFSRNVYRGGALAYSNDGLCRKLCHEGLKVGADVPLPSVQRSFFYLPLQHSERLADQELAVELYDQLARSETGMLREFLESFLVSARHHRDIIGQFGRFPHRNSVLKRRSTAEEIRYLAGSGRRFGQ